jgi:[acyl-carrier-protein] S-malonyltransferase
MGLGILCPGQGSQHPAMLDMLAGSVAAQGILSEASEAFGQDLRALAKTSAEIYRNRIAQPLLCATEMATWAALKDTLPVPRVFAGYSLGELAAYGCAGALSPADLVDLASHRARLMDAATEKAGALFAVRGLPRRQVEALCQKFGAEIAIINGDDRFIIGAAADAAAAYRAAAIGCGAAVTRLPIEVAAHTRSLTAASQAFRARLNDSNLVAPAVPVLAGVNGMPIRNRQEAIEVLSRQISTTIDWSACLLALPEFGCTVLVELGPGSALSRMAREQFPDLPSRSVADFRSLEAVIDWVYKFLPRQKSQG